MSNANTAVDDVPMQLELLRMDQAQNRLKQLHNVVGRAVISALSQTRLDVV